MSNTETKSLRLSLSTSGPGADIHVVRVDGIVDTVTSPELDAVLASLVGQGRRRIIVDLAGTSYISSAGWGTFISRLREIRDGGGDLHLARMTADVREIYDLLEFEGVLPYHDRLEAAHAAFNGGNGKEQAVASKPPPSRADAQNVGTIPVRHESGITHTPLGATALEAAVLQLVVEDPFYTIRELRGRLVELGHGSPGWWTIWQTLRHRNLLPRRSRFRYFRRHQGGILRSTM
jgi:anti-anti-sigma factor